MASVLSPSQNYRLRLTIQGAVQGVGFRPFIYRLATELQLSGWVNNSAQGVFIEVEGNRETLETFLQRIEPEKPPRSHIQSLEASWLDPVSYQTFEIRASVAGAKTAVVLPDIAICDDCLREILDPHNRRYCYPFTNCTNCGPRYSIIKALPYDRSNTTMSSFEMCPQCRAEYENPLNRRFHAQPNACPHCGPHVELWDATGKVLASRDRALFATADAIREGKIVAVKGLGGFHLMVDARNTAAVNQLRQRKRRSQKPFAVMYPSLKLVKVHCEVNAAEERLLRSPESPIVLLKQKVEHAIVERPAIASELHPDSEAVAPGNLYLGVMLPYTPLHHLLMKELGFPVVATSGNLSDEPICISDCEALHRLGQIADLFLVHDRAIARAIDDSVVRVILGREMVMRRSRGYAPLPIQIANLMSKNSPCETSESPRLLAVGGHLKNTIAIAHGERVFISQHIGDLETAAAFDSFKQTIASLKEIYEFEPIAVAYDAHPDYRSTQFAQSLRIPAIAVQHHYAHILACMAENEIDAPVLGIAWDGTGYGLDGTIWGGEFLHVNERSCDRVAHFRPFKLPGGDKAVKEPRRVALGLLYEILGEKLFDMKHQLPLQTFSAQELAILKTMLHRKINTPITSSAGRLFDAVASIIGLRQTVSFEGQAAMELEFALDGIETNEHYPVKIGNRVLTNQLAIDWAPTILEIQEDMQRQQSVGLISAKFHNTLVEAIIAIAKQVGESRVVLSGGCFQNKYLTERAVSRLKQENFRPYWHQRIPTNDGGIALGQIMAAFRGG